jgi:mannose-1-phosphate guanylyltransferase/phosphomannomutase
MLIYSKQTANLKQNNNERMNRMKTVIMAGGEGTRLRPLTCNRPKPMVPIANKPVMEHIIELVKKYDMRDIAVTLQYMPEQIKEYFSDGGEFGVNLRYYEEKTPLGTAGSVKNAEDFLNDIFVVISGDALTDINLEDAVKFHLKNHSIATLVLKKVDIPLEYGVVVTDKKGRITRFLEKPSWGEVFSDTVNTGIYILSPEVLSFFRKDEIFDFSKNLFPILLKEGLPMYGYVTDDYWCDIGDLRAYKQAHADIMEGKVRLSVPGKKIQKGIWIDEGTEIEEGARIESPCIIGKYNKIKKNSHIGEYSVIGDFNIIEERTSIKRSIIFKNCMIDKNVQLRGSVISSKVHMRESSSAFENSVIGDDTVVKDNAVIKPNIKIWPGKLIDSGVEVNSNLIWGTRFSRTIFGNRGIGGQINIDIIPEYASKLGAAYGSIHNGKGKLGVSCDASSTAQMIKISFIAGLLSAGMEVYDLGKMLLPITRSAIRFYKMDGGIHISTYTEDPTKLFIDFLDKSGGNYDRGTERKIENAFIREDFNRCDGSCINEVRTIPDYSEFYLLGIINSIKSKKLNYRIALNTRSEFISSVMSRMLGETGCQIELTDLRLMNTKTKKPDYLYI